MSPMKNSAIGTRYGSKHLEGRREGGGARRRRHGHGQDVVGEQRGAGDLGGGRAEVVLGDHVGAAGRRVLLDRLAVRQDQEAEHHAHGDGDREHQRERHEPRHRHQDVQDLLGGVRRRRQVVGGEDGEGGGLAEPLVLELLAVQGLAEQRRLSRYEIESGGSGTPGSDGTGPGRGAVRSGGVVVRATGSRSRGFEVLRERYGARSNASANDRVKMAGRALRSRQRDPIGTASSEGRAFCGSNGGGRSRLGRRPPP